MYIINVAAKLELFLGYLIVAGHPVFPSSYKVISGGVKAFFVTQDYTQNYNSFTEEEIYI